MSFVIRLLPVCLVFVLVLMPLQALSQDQPAVALGSDEIYARSLKALTMLLVAAVLIENALAVLFNWRVFLTYFSLRGVKTIISVVVSYIVVQTFDLDIVGSLLKEYAPNSATGSNPGLFLTALILSGGSSGVNSLMVSLGYRDRGREADVTPQAPATQAWIAVRVKRVASVGPVHVHVTEVASPNTDPSAIAGTIGFRRPSLLELLLRNPNRFPQNGGYVVEPDKVYKIEIASYDAQNQPLPDPLAGREYRFAPRAIVDFEVTL
jgi:hypothetical protein